MKKAIFAALALALTFGAFQDSRAEMRTSATLANETGMISDISQPRTGIPAGFIMAFPLNGSPNNPDWLECNGQAIPAGSDLYNRGMRNTPNLYAGNGKGYFLRAGAASGQLVADSFRSHAHGQPAHTHSWEGKLSSLAVSSLGGSGGTMMDSGETIESFAKQAAQEQGLNGMTTHVNWQNGWKQKFQAKLSSKPYFTVGRNYVAGKYPTAQWNSQTQSAYIPATGHMEYDSNDGTVLSSYVEDSSRAIA